MGKRCSHVHHRMQLCWVDLPFQHKHVHWCTFLCIYSNLLLKYITTNRFSDCCLYCNWDWFFTTLIYPIWFPYFLLLKRVDCIWLRATPVLICNSGYSLCLTKRFYFSVNVLRFFNIYFRYIFIYIYLFEWFKQIDQSVVLRVGFEINIVIWKFMLLIFVFFFHLSFISYFQVCIICMLVLVYYNTQRLMKYRFTFFLWMLTHVLNSL